MRHPTTGLSEDDLSRLTGSSSSTASAVSDSNKSNNNNNNHNNNNNNNNNHDLSPSSSSSSSSTTPADTPTKCIEGELFEQISKLPDGSQINSVINNGTDAITTRFKSTYLPEILNPLDWQKSRKRKERLDSTSSTRQDPKLQRSNSEELVLTQANKIDILPTLEALTAADGNLANALKSVNRPSTETIRRVSSEDFKKTSTYAAYLEQEIYNIEANAENDNCKVETARKQEQDEAWISQCGHSTNDMTRRSRYETSPARSQRFSPIRGGSVVNNNNNNNTNNNTNNYNNNNNVGTNQSGSNKHRDVDDSDCEHERRRSSERFCKARATPGRKSAGVVKKNNNALAGSNKCLPSRLSDENAYKYDLSSLKYERRGFISKKVGVGADKEKSSNIDLNDNNLIDFNQQKDQGQVQIKKTVTSPTPSSAGSEDNTAVVAPRPPKRTINIPTVSTPQESLPWDRAVPEDQTPILSRRYATARPHGDNIDTAVKLSKIMPYPQKLMKQQSAVQLLDNDEDDCMEASEAFRVFTSLENLRTREVMQQVLPAIMSFQSPEERLKQINKRLTAMKKKLAQLEEAYETRNGYRPSQADRLNDKYMKNILSELNKLRKERHELKSDPMGALGLKVSGGLDAEKKLDQMKTTLNEIEQNLIEKRKSVQRPASLEVLTADQLVQEKTAVQHGLLYFESLYGRPTTKEERDAARPLYDRYRQLKRMVSRSVLLSSGVAGGTDLPTILEHEAMSFEYMPQQYSSNNSTETSNSPSESTQNGSSEDAASSTTTTNTATKTVTDKSNSGNEVNENIAGMSIDQLWDYLERTREEKKLLKSSIREYETVFEQENGRKMLKNDRRNIEETYAQYKEKKAKTRLLQALIKKQIAR